jgi:hypothetical protein
VREVTPHWQLNLAGIATRGLRLRDMKRLEAHRAVLEFLDQFISRGASPSVLAFRDRFAMDPTEWERLDALLPSDAPSEVEAYEAMREIFRQELEAAGPEDRSGADFLNMVSWTERQPDGQTSDPAQWHDWLGSVARATQFPDPDAFNTVLRARGRFLHTDEGGRRSPIHDDYRATSPSAPLATRRDGVATTALLPCLRTWIALLPARRQLSAHTRETPPTSRSRLDLTRSFSSWKAREWWRRHTEPSAFTTGLDGPSRTQLTQRRARWTALSHLAAVAPPRSPLPRRV